MPQLQKAALKSVSEAPEEERRGEEIRANSRTLECASFEDETVKKAEAHLGHH